MKIKKPYNEEAITEKIGNITSFHSKRKYILINKKAVPEPNLLKWCRWLENIQNRRVALDELPNGYRVSTIFLGLDHNFLMSGDPLLFETMVFKERESNDLDMTRYSTWEEAEEGHEKMVKRWRRKKLAGKIKEKL